MPRKRRRSSKFVTKRSLPFQLMKFAETKRSTDQVTTLSLVQPATFANSTLILHDITQGIDQSKRIGEEVQASGYYCRFYFASVSQTIQWCRVVVYSPRLVDTTEIPLTDINDMADPSKFIIWSDKSVAPAGQIGGGSGIVTLRKKFKPYMKLRWESASGTDITKGSLFVLFLCNVNDGATVHGISRLYFKDV